MQQPAVDVEPGARNPSGATATDPQAELTVCAVRSAGSCPGFSGNVRKVSTGPRCRLSPGTCFSRQGALIPDTWHPPMLGSAGLPEGHPADPSTAWSLICATA